MKNKELCWKSEVLSSALTGSSFWQENWMWTTKKSDSADKTNLTRASVCTARRGGTWTPFPNPRAGLGRHMAGPATRLACQQESNQRHCLGHDSDCISIQERPSETRAALVKRDGGRVSMGTPVPLLLSFLCTAAPGTSSGKPGRNFSLSDSSVQIYFLKLKST